VSGKQVTYRAGKGRTTKKINYMKAPKLSRVEKAEKNLAKAKQQLKIAKLIEKELELSKEKK